MAFMSGEREVSLYMINPPLLQLLSNDLIIHVRRKPNVVEYVTHCLGMRVTQGDGIIANDFYTGHLTYEKRVYY